MEKINKSLYWGIIASESIHIFCCALPTVFSILSLLAGFGLIAAMPVFMDDIHHVIHIYEMPMIIVSGIILFLGWVLYLYSKKISCRTQGTCRHEPCTPRKDRTKHFMILATVLFVINVSVYFVFHRGLDTYGQTNHAHEIHGHDHHSH